MRVTACLFNPPGRGEMITNRLTMPDAAMPSTPEDFALRSVRAMKHFWPHCTTGKATALQQNTGRVVIDGPHWSVEWALDAHINDIENFVNKYLNGVSTWAEVFAAADSITPTKELAL